MNAPPSNSPEPAVPAAQRRFSSMFRSLRSRDFALFWGVNFLSNIGTWMQNLALGWVILLMTNSPFLLGLNGFLTQAPSLLFSLPGGAIADRLNRRKLMLYTQTYMMLLALILAVLTSFKVIRIHEILFISLLTGLASALNNPAYQALYPDLVEREDLTNAVALNSAQFNLSRAVGPMLAGLALCSLGAAWCFYLNSVSFMALIIPLLIIAVPHQHSGKLTGVWEAILDGLRFVRQKPILIILLTVPAFLSLLGLPFVVLMPAIARDMVHTGASGLGYLMAGAGLGAVASALILASLEDPAHKVNLILSSAALFSLGVILLATVHSFWWAFVVLMVLGSTMVGALALTNSTLQMSSPPALRGRVMSMYNLAVLGLAPFGSLQMGTIGQAWGMRIALALGGSVCLVYFLSLLALLPRLQRLATLPRSGRPETAGR